MSQPTPYDRSTSFANFQAASPSSPLPGSSLDAELNAVKATLDQTLQNLALVQRDDGALANGSVGTDQLAVELTVGFNVPTAWAQSTAYTSSPASTVFYAAQFFRCITSHTSGAAFDSTKWALIADFSSIAIGSAANVAFTPVGNIAASTVQAALAEVDAEKALLVHTHVAADISDSTTAGRSMLSAANVAAQQTLLGITHSYFQPGDWKYTNALALETGWLYRDGSSYLRTDYPALFAAIAISTTGNTTNGSPIITNIPSTAAMRLGMPVNGTNISGFAATILTVDSATQITLSANATGTTTAGALVVAPHGCVDATHFNVPDGRGRASFGRDDQGVNGTAGRITVAGVGVLGTRHGATGGAQTVTLLTANLPVTTPTGTVAITDPGHTHTYTALPAGGNFPRADSAGSATATATTGSSTTGITAAFTGTPFGSGTATNKMPPFEICDSIIKT